MSGLLRRSSAVIAILAVAGIVGVLLIGSTAPSPIGAQPDPAAPSGEVAPQPASQPAPQSTGQPAPSPRTGADVDLGFQLSAHHSDRADQAIAVLDRLRRAGARWVRVDVGWQTLQPQGPGPFDQWYVELLDEVFTGARERGLRVIVSLWLSPSWATDGGSPYAPPDDVGDYADAIAAAARRWGADVAAWEIWNEPNFPVFFEGADPATYTRLLCAAYPAVKRYDDAPVVFGGLMYNDDGWLRRAYEAGARDCFDVLATHPYVGPSDAPPDTPAVGAVWRLTHTPAVRAVMEEWGDGAKQIWITELGWSSGPDSAGNPWDRSVTPRQQAAYLGDAVRLVRARYPYVGPIIWYRDIDGPSDTYQDGFGLLHPDLRPKPALRALRDAARRR
ncbi:cellulase family glycosylhydrolase [Nocardioides sp. L-11A]|uniref:cellulase family glycosylhydrolase n=1 Tax=Nocardioides sp. L-11A TaxID=3043848 RepID=UPI002499F7B8|nr:cellulase family glycosylhydrolase [Nocardioides sp. L-11A]